MRGAATPMAEITAWLWSPSAPAMDMRSYRSPGEMDTFEKQVEDRWRRYDDPAHSRHALEQAVVEAYPRLSHRY